MPLTPLNQCAWDCYILVRTRDPHGVQVSCSARLLSGFRTIWSREMLNGFSLLVNSCFKDKIGRGVYIALWPVTKNWSATIIPSAENHGECPDMPPRRRPDRIFAVPRLYSPDVAPFNYHLFRSMAHGLAHRHFRFYEEVKK